jgi:hypothetical protein
MRALSTVSVMVLRLLMIGHASIILGRRFVGGGLKKYGKRRMAFSLVSRPPCSRPCHVLMSFSAWADEASCVEFSPRVARKNLKSSRRDFRMRTKQDVLMRG